MAVLDERLEALAYQHVLVDDPYVAQLNLDTTAGCIDLSARHGGARRGDRRRPRSAGRWNSRGLLAA